MNIVVFGTIFALSFGALAQAQPAPPPPPPPPNPIEGFYVARDFQFGSGEKMEALRLHFTTLGQPRRDSSGQVRNAVLIMHGTGGTGNAFLSPNFAGQLFGPGQPLDATRYFIILPDAIGHGKSSKPSDGLRAHFPHYDYDDMVRANYLLVNEGLRINHLRLVMGTSMGAMHTWIFGEMYPDFMDALLPLASAPVQIAGRNRILRKMIIDAIRTDPGWKGGDYTQQPRGLISAYNALFMMTSSPWQLYRTAPTRDQADAEYEKVKARAAKADANDMLYHFDASRNYDPSPKLEQIRAPLWAINSADDEVNPPELGILEREIKRVPKGRYILLPTTAETRGHGTHSLPAVWKQYLVDLLAASEPVPAVFRVAINTTKGEFIVECHRDWAPQAADRFYELVRSGYFDDSRFFRVRPGYIAQFGIAGDPRVAAAWRARTIPDDPRKQSNLRGFLAFAMTGPDTRSTQIYVNLVDNTRLDAEGFAPFASVVAGMEVLDQLYGDYGETSGGGMRAGKQDAAFREGNAYFDREFPKLDRLVSAKLILPQ